MDKQKVLDNLYALRAGLSVISQKYEKTQAIENDCGEKLAKNAKDFCDGLHVDGNEYPELSELKTRYGYKRDLSEEYNAIKEETKNNFKERITKQKELRANNDHNACKAYGHWLVSDECDGYFSRVLKDAQTEKDNVIDGNDSHTHGLSYKKESKREKTLSIVFFSIAAVLAVIIAIGFATMDVKSEIIVAVFLIIAFLVFLILGIVYICKSKNDKASHIKRLNEAEELTMAAQQLIDNLPQNKEKTRAILKEKDEKIAPIKQSCNDFYMALKKQFNSLLDERDWQNLDLVIYEIETRRADSVKEALQLVDRELQTERIQQTIALATEQICYEIRRGFAELKETIIECSRVISSQLSAISLQLNDIGGQLAELCDSVNMSNALQAKANVTSNQLLSDVHAIRYYQ